MKHLSKKCLPSLFALGLAGCQTIPSPVNCPQVAVLQQASALTLYLPGRSDVAAQITSAQVTGVAGACVLEKQKHLLVVTLQAGFSASNGPADHGADVHLPYFVAISQGDEIISKTLYDADLSFDGNMSTVTAQSRSVKIELPNVPMSTGMQILVGFQLTPAQLQAAGSQ